MTSGLRDEVWIEHTSYELDGERLYELHDVSRALEALNLSWPEGLPESTMGGDVVERKNTSAGEIDRCERRLGNVDRGWDPPEGHSSSGALLERPCGFENKGE